MSKAYACTPGTCVKAPSKEPSLLLTNPYWAVSEDMEGVSGKYLADCAIIEP